MRERRQPYKITRGTVTVVALVLTAGGRDPASSNTCRSSHLRRICRRGSDEDSARHPADADIGTGRPARGGTAEDAVERGEPLSVTRPAPSFSRAR
jgi:hypothetical protein